jgi:hypothetical protein
MHKFHVQQRLKWVAQRDTKKEEDIPYCLLGMFDVYLPLIYGEGRRNAFRRLKEGIAKERDFTRADRSEEYKIKYMHYTNNPSDQGRKSDRLRPCYCPSRSYGTPPVLPCVMYVGRVLTRFVEELCKIFHRCHMVDTP